MKTHPTTTCLLFLALGLSAACKPSNEIRALQPELTVVTEAGTADTLDFGEVEVPQEVEQLIQVLNAGRADLNITDIRVAGDDAGVYSIEPTTAVVEPDDSLGVAVRFAPDDFARYDYTLVIESNDPTTPSYEVSLLGEGVDGPIPDIELSETTLSFDDVPVGTEAIQYIELRNVGDGPLSIDRIGSTGSGNFRIESGPETGGIISGPGEEPLVVSYVPTGDEGDSATLTIYSDDPDEPEVELTLIGNGGSTIEYPVAVIDCPDEVDPPTTVTMDGADSYDPVDESAVLSYEWRLIDQPLGSISTIADPTAESIDLFVDAAGRWTTQLRVTNGAGHTSAPATCTFNADPQSAIHVELSWDKDDSDLDLHFLQDGAELFEIPGDATWCADADEGDLDWGASGVSIDDPVLTQENREGYGPESTVIDEPADGDYEVKVHYFEDNGAGRVTATVKVWINGGTAPFWQGSKSLESNQVWDVGTIRWPQEVFAVDDADLYRATRSYCFTP